MEGYVIFDKDMPTRDKWRAVHKDTLFFNSPAAAKEWLKMRGERISDYKFVKFKIADKSQVRIKSFSLNPTYIGE